MNHSNSTTLANDLEIKIFGCISTVTQHTKSRFRQTVNHEMSIGYWEDDTDWRSKMRVSREFLWWWCCYFAQQRWLPFRLGIVISVYIFNAIQRIKLQIGGKRICCMIQEYYVSKLNGMLTLLGFVSCIGEPEGSVTDWLAWLLGGFWL